MNTTAKSLSESQMYHIPFFADDTSQTEKNRFIFYHNHPFSGSFSFKDMRTLNSFESLKEMVAVGHDGTVFSLKVGKRLTDDEIKVLFSDCGTEPESLKNL